MTRWATLAIALLFSAIATVHTTDTASGQDGWITLFDGKNLDQWQGDGTATFKIEDGSVIATDKKDPKAVAAYLVSKQSFKDFEIRAEFWVSDDANSGIFVRNTDPKNISSKTGYEVNIFDQRPDPTYGTGAIVPFAKSAVPIKAGGKWNTYEIVAKGPKFTVTLNGVKTVDGAENADHKEGPIALQFGVGTVKYRKVLIKPL
jgi:3-keto-disaccharide hydrolase